MNNQELYERVRKLLTKNSLTCLGKLPVEAYNAGVKDSLKEIEKGC